MAMSFIQLMKTVSPIIQTRSKIHCIASTKQVVQISVYEGFGYTVCPLLNSAMANRQIIICIQVYTLVS